MKREIKKILLTVVLIGFFSFISFYIYNNYHFWTHFKTDNFIALTDYNGKNISGKCGAQILIHKGFKKHIEQIDKYADANNIKLIINHSYRPKNYNLSGAIVTPAKLSNHYCGFAIDFNIKYNGKIYSSIEFEKSSWNNLPSNIHNFINDIRKNKDLRWGGDFQIKDVVHIDSPLNLKDKNKWIEFSRDCDLDYSNRIPKWKFWK